MTEELKTRARDLRVLMIEDSPADAQLVLRELRRAGFEPTWKRVQHLVDVVAQLTGGEDWDVNLCDYSLPSLDAPAVLARLRGLGIDLPVIVISGAASEEAMVRTMRAGAQDYVLKDNMTRLAPAIERELAETKVRRKQKSGAEELKKNRERYARLVATSIDAIVTTDAEGRITDWNDAATRVFGYSCEEAVGMDAHGLLAPERFRNEFEAGLDRFHRTGMGKVIGRIVEVKARRKDGSEIEVELSISPMRVEKEWHATAVIRDISARKREERLRDTLYRISEAAAASEDLDALCASIHGAVAALIPVDIFTLWILDPGTGGLVPVYASGCTKHAPEAEIRAALRVMSTRSSFLANRDELVALMDGEIDPTARGSPPLAWLGVPLVAQAEIVGVMAVQSHTDVSAYGSQAREVLSFVSAQVAGAIQRRRLVALQERLATMVERTSEILLNLDPDGVVEYANPAIERVLGYPPSMVVGRRIADLVVPEARGEQLREVWRAVREGTPWTGQMPYLAQDGSSVLMDMSVTPLLAADGEISGYICIQRDVTQEVRLEEQLLQAQKMEAVGRLAGGVAHDFNNLLTVIGGYSELVLKNMRADDPLRSKVVEILKNSDRAAALTRHLLDLSRQQVLKARVLDLNQVVVGLSGMLDRLAGKTVAIKVRLDPDLWRVSADPARFEQVVMNLIVNACDAMPSEGTLKLSTSNVERMEEESDHGFDTLAGPCVRLSVVDSGTGMPPEVLERIFEPFFSTRGREQGTGLGLSTVFGIIKQSGGAVHVKSAPGCGTRFSVYLPRCEDEPAPSDPTPAKDPALRGSETIVVVEDESAVRSYIVEALEGAGFRALGAACSEEALKILQNGDGKIDLVLTDVILPDFTGPELAARWRETRPGGKVLYMSGYTGGALPRGEDFTPANLLEKPFSPDELTRAVRRVLDAP